MAELQNIILTDHFFDGEDKSIPCTIRNDGALQNITGWTISWKVKRRKQDDDDEAVLTKDTSGGIALTDPDDGLCTISVQRADSADITPERQYWHELRRTDSGFNTVLLYGEFTLNRSVHE